MAETNRVLRDKFQWDGHMLQDSREKLRALGNHVSPTDKLHVIKEDPDNDRILECAAAAESDFIVREDKDLLRLGEFGNARIVSIRTSSVWRSRPGPRDRLQADRIPLLSTSTQCFALS